MSKTGQTLPKFRFLTTFALPALLVFRDFLMTTEQRCERRGQFAGAFARHGDGRRRGGQLQ